MNLIFYEYEVDGMPQSYAVIIQVRNQENAVRPRTGAPPSLVFHKPFTTYTTISHIIAIIMTDG